MAGNKEKKLTSIRYDMHWVGRASACRPLNARQRMHFSALSVSLATNNTSTPNTLNNLKH